MLSPKGVTWPSTKVDCAVCNDLGVLSAENTKYKQLDMINEIEAKV